MVWDSVALHTRQFARREIELPAQIDIDPDQAEQVRLSFPDQHRRVRVIDVSEGGLGLATQVFLPRNLRVDVTIPLAGDDPEAPARPLAMRAVVRRCVLIDVKPAYQVGLEFVDTDPDDVRALLKSLGLANVAAAGGPTAPAKGGAT